MLEAKMMTMQFGGLKAVDQVSFFVPEGKLYGLIGPNGAGKTTAFNMLTGVYQPTSGEVFFQGKSIRGLRPHLISKMGLSRTFQNIRLFKNLSVLENASLPTLQHVNINLADVFFKTAKFLNFEKKTLEKALHTLDLFGLADFKDEKSSALPYGHQRKLEIVRALMSDPKMLLLDEPAAGMNHSETEQLMRLIEKIRKEFNVTILLIEHDMKLVMGICEKIFVLDHGIKIADGTAQEIRNSPAVIEAYLGKSPETVTTPSTPGAHG